jgi:hypothetical protein
MATVNEKQYRINFVNAIKDASDTDKFEDACSHWEFEEMKSPGMAGRCICNHPIKVDYIIKNKINGKRLVVGSDCVARFFSGNATLTRDVELALKNRKREEEGKPPVVVCIYCDKTVTQRKHKNPYLDRHYETRSYHNACVEKDYRDNYPERHPETTEWIKEIIEYTSSGGIPEKKDERTFLFVDSLRIQYEEKKYLSYSQHDTLRKIHKRIAREKKKKV